MLKIYIIIGLSVLALIFFISSHMFAPTLVIKIIPDGFKPDELTVNQGTVVRFINEDMVDRWPASDFHPTHEIYPEFDPKVPIPPGKSWQIKVTKDESFRYHDHLYPHRKGLVVVKNAKTAVENKQSQNLNKEGEYQNIKQMAEKLGLQETREYILNMYKNDTSKARKAHDTAHFFGKLTFELEGLSGLGICGAEFGWGCHHGFTEAAFLNGLDKLNQIEEGCKRKSECIQGLGHGIASYFAAKDLAGSLKSCDLLSDDQKYCYEGVFMSFASDAPASFYAGDDLLFPCSKVEAQYQQSCAQSLPAVLVKRRHMTPEEVVKACQALPSHLTRAACINGKLIIPTSP